MAKVYTGTGRHFQELEAVSLDKENLQDINHRVKFQPHFLGEPLVIIGEAKDLSLEVSETSQELIGLDVLGRIVIISLAVGVADSDSRVDTRALQMAAHLATLPVEELGKIARAFITRPLNDQLFRHWEDLGVEMSKDAVELSSLLAATFNRDAGDYTDLINTEQRIIIAAEGFTSSLVDVIDWLVRGGIHISGLRYQKYLVGGQEIFFAEQIVPARDPAVDAKVEEVRTTETIEPWKAKGRAYHIEQLTPTLGNLLDRLLISTRDETFSINWAHKYFFWMRGARRNLRVRTYHRDRIELGFYNASSEAISDFLLEHDIEEPEVYLVGGYSESPFIAITSETQFDDRWTRMIRQWLAGSPATTTATDDA